MTLKQRYEHEKKLILIDAEEIRTATDWTELYLKHGSACDSGDRQKIRVGFVNQATTIFIEKNKKEILNLAADLCLKSIGEGGE